MIPPVVDPRSSPGERHVFELLAQDSSTDGWIALHSLDIAQHRRQISGEADFLVLVPESGVVVLEVKGHRQVRRDHDGLWRLRGRSPYSAKPL